MLNGYAKRVYNAGILLQYLGWLRAEHETVDTCGTVPNFVFTHISMFPSICNVIVSRAGFPSFGRGPSLASP